MTSPAPGATNVSLSPTFTWNAVTGTGWPSGATIGIEMYDITADLDLPFDSLPLSATSWTPPVMLVPDHSYQFEIGVGITDSSAEVTANGDDYTYIEISPKDHQALWHTYEDLPEQFPDNFAMHDIQSQEDIYPVFHELFRRKTS